MKIGDRILGGKRCGTGHFGPTIESVERLAQKAVLVDEPIAVSVGHYLRSRFDDLLYKAHHAFPPLPASSASESTIVRLASSTLKALCFCGIANANSASAAWEKFSGVGGLPSRNCSATEARHGLCDTPPSARRTSPMFLPSSRKAAATETK